MAEFAKKYAKFLAAAAAGVVALVSVMPDGVTGAEWLVVAAAVLGPLGVVITPNKPDETEMLKQGYVKR